MKDKVIKVGTENYYVLDELEYKGKKYIYCIECDKTVEEVTENYLVLEVRVQNEDLIVDNINDYEIQSVVNNLFLARIQLN